MDSHQLIRSMGYLYCFMHRKNDMTMVEVFTWLDILDQELERNVGCEQLQECAIIQRRIIRRWFSRKIPPPEKLVNYG